MDNTDGYDLIAIDDGFGGMYDKGQLAQFIEEVTDAPGSRQTTIRVRLRNSNLKSNVVYAYKWERLDGTPVIPQGK
jgi:hypothetical protein